MRLVEDGDGTILRYEAKADVGGKLAQLGGRLIDATARSSPASSSASSARWWGRHPPATKRRGAETEQKPGVLRRWFGKKKDDAEGGSAE